MSIFKWGVLLVALLVGAVALGAGVATAHDSGTEVRITAMRLDDGRIEFALQEREGEGWGERILPRGRFFPTTSSGRWLNSTPITVGLVSGMSEPTATATATPTATPAPTTTATATPEPTSGFSISGTGNDVRTVNADGSLVCRASVTDNASQYGTATNFIVWIHGSNTRELLVNEIGVSASDSTVVEFGGQGLFSLSPPYRVEVDAVGAWTVTCQ